MLNDTTARIAVVDYGMGNLHSVARACHHAGIETVITSDPEVVAAAPALVLPGVGAFRDAMANLADTGLAEALCTAAAESRPVLGICLGFQLLMSESYEFGTHRGLGLVEGVVERLRAGGAGSSLKVPHVGWNTIHRTSADGWSGTPLEGLSEPASMYFVHSFGVTPDDPSDALSATRYGGEEFCSTLRRGSIYGCQYHPELSGAPGVAVITAFAAQASRTFQHSSEIKDGGR